jgi:nitrogen regulatory protein PII
MKLLIAYVQPQKLNEVKHALYKEDIRRFTVADVYGHSDEDLVHEHYRGIEVEVDLLKKIKFEIALNDNYVEKAVKAIKSACRSGKLGDGKIIIVPIEKVYRIRSDDEDSTAIG